MSGDDRPPGHGSAGRRPGPTRRRPENRLLIGFAVSRRRDADHGYLRRRRPALTRSLEIDGYRFTRYLSGPAGGHGPQPVVDGDVVCISDGEIYGAVAETGGAEDPISLYRRHGEDFAGRLDGDFALALYDFGRRVLLLANGPFGSKPLFVMGTEVASSRGALGGGERVAPNAVTVVDLDTGEHRRTTPEPFDFDHQHKESYDDWIRAFERAVARRAAEGCYVPLSAGYDSGGIDCALDRLGVIYKAYSIEGRENVDLLRRRNRAGEILRMDEATYAERGAFLRANAESETFRVTIFTGEEEDYDVLEDPATRGLALIHSRARAEGRRVFLSGQGADETLAACRHWPGTRFPENLEPWPDFAGNWQTAYLAKEEAAARACGVEARYPFLDRAVVQEFLWLAPELKNRHYKAPLHEYMTRCGYPFDENVKTGFTPLPRRS